MAHTATAHTVRMATVLTVRPLITATAATRRRAVTAQHPAGLPLPIPTPHLAATAAVALTPAPVEVTAEVEAAVLMAEVEAATVAEVVDTISNLSNFGPLRKLEAGHFLQNHGTSFAASSLTSTTLLVSPCYK